MEIIWQLFGIHISTLLAIILLLIAWLVWPRKHTKVRKALIRLDGLLLLGAIIISLYTYWPYSYQKTYLNQEISEEIKSTPLKQLADSSELYVGIAIVPNNPLYKNIADEFNSVTATNSFKPKQLLIDPETWQFDFNVADSLLFYAESQHLRMRGHTLIWGKFPGRTFPLQWIKQVKTAKNPKEEMKAIMKRYITEVMGHFKGRVPTWDVANEPMNGSAIYPSIFYNILGEEYLDYAFQIAHEADSSCSLFLNEQIPDYDGPTGRAFLSLLERLVKRKVPINGVGLQCHNIKSLHDADALERYISAIGAFGLKVEITELDIRLLLFDKERDPYAAQGEQYRKIVSACVNNPACKGVTFWGLTDASNWLDQIPPFKWKSPNAPNILDEEMNKKPAYIGVWKALHSARDSRN